MRKNGSRLAFVLEFVYHALCAAAPCQCTRVLTPWLCVPPPGFRLGLGFRFRRSQCACLDPAAVGAGPQDFERMKLIGQGDVGKVYLVRLQESTNYFAIKALLVPKGN